MVLKCKRCQVKIGSGNYCADCIKKSIELMELKIDKLIAEYKKEIELIQKEIDRLETKINAS